MSPEACPAVGSERFTTSAVPWSPAEQQVIHSTTLAKLTSAWADRPRSACFDPRRWEKALLAGLRSTKSLEAAHGSCLLSHVHRQSGPENISGALDHGRSAFLQCASKTILAQYGQQRRALRLLFAATGDRHEGHRCRMGRLHGRAS